MRRRVPLTAGITALALVATVNPAAAHVVDGELPGGTGIEVAITSPADGAVLPAGPVSVTGTAAVDEREPTADLAIIYVLDVSGSTLVPASGCGGGPTDDLLDCEIAAAQNLNRAAVSLNAVGAVGVVVFGGRAEAADVNPGPADELITGPTTDDNDNGVPDIEEVLGSANNSLTIGGTIELFTRRRAVTGNTDFGVAIAKATEVATDPANTMNQTIVVFLSDGIGSGDVPGALANVPANVDFFTFAFGPGSACGDPANIWSLAHIATQTGGACEWVPDPAALPHILPGVIASKLNALTLTVDGGGPTPVTDVTPDLPQLGPASVDYAITTGALAPGSHELCVTAAGLEIGGGGDVTDCHTVTINAPPTVAAGGPYAGREDTPVTLGGEVLDPDTPGVQVQWTITPTDAVDPGTTCRIADAAAPTTTVECTDDGEFTLTLTADDGINPPVSRQTTLTLGNAAPTAEITAPENEVLVPVGADITVEAAFTDDGTNDTHTCTVDFDDGSPVADGTVDQEPGSGTCAATHRFDTAGTHQVLVTVTDDDGAAATDVVTVVTHLPGEAFAIQAQGLVTIARTPLATCPPDEALTSVRLNAAIATVDALSASCAVDEQTGETVAAASIDEVSLLGGVITISDIESTCVANENGVTGTSRVGTINGTPIGVGSGSLTVPLVAQVFFNETTTGPDGRLVQNAVRVQTILGQQIILAGCRLG